MLVLRGGSGDIVAEQEALGDHGARAPEHLANYSLVQRQRAHIEEALMHVGRAVDPAEAGATLPFKALLYDPHWRDILALSMPVSELCLHGVLAHGTLHQASKASSEAAPAVYLVQPTRANLDLVAQDAERRAFRSQHIFASGPTSDAVVADFEKALPSPRPRLEWVDIHLDFLAIGPHVFELGLRDCYKRLHASAADPQKPTQSRPGSPPPPTSSDAADDVIEGTVNGLYNVLSTCHLRPIIRAQLGTRAQEVADRLLVRIRQRLAKDPAAFLPPPCPPSPPPPHGGAQAAAGGPGEGESKRRPLLVIADRLIDIPIMLHHHCDYRPLVHDCLGIHVNAVTLPGSNAGESLTWPLSARDSFWAENAGRPFPHVVKNLEQGLSLQGKRKTSVPVAGRADSPLEPEAKLMFEKRVMSTHAKMISELARRIEVRALDDFFEVEARVLSQAAALKSDDLDAVEDLISGHRVAGVDDEGEAQRRRAASSAADRMRLFLILYLCCPALAEDLLQELVGLLVKGGADMRVFKHLVSIKQRYPWVGARPSGNVVSGLLAAGADRLRKLVRERCAGQLATMVRSLLGPPEGEDGGAGAAELRGVGGGRGDGAGGGGGGAGGGGGGPRFSYIDPFRDRGEARSEPDHIMTFVVGGGKYVEMADVCVCVCVCVCVLYTYLYMCMCMYVYACDIGNYVEMADVAETLAECGWHSVYGATDMVNPDQFLAQLCQSAEAE